MKENQTQEKRPPSRAALVLFLEYLVVFVAGSLPGDQLANGRTGTGNGLLVGFHFRARGFFAHGADAESDLLLFRTHLDDLEVVLQARLKMKRLAVLVGRFGLVAQAFHALGNFDKGEL